MKKSTEYLIGETVTVQNVIYTKQSNETPNLDGTAVPEIWIDENGQQYEPSLDFELGQSDPYFNIL